MTNAKTDQAAAKPGLGDLAEIFYAPGDVFARRQDGSFGLAYIALVVLGVAVFYATKGLVQPAIDAEISRQMAVAAAKNNMTPEAVATATSFTHSVASFGIIAFYLIAPFIIGLFIWIVGMLAKVTNAGKTAIMIAVFSFYPRVVGSVVGAVLAALLPDASLTSAASLSLSPARFIDPSHTAVVALLGRFDLFILWGVVLIAIGLQSAAKATKNQAWGTAIGVWAVGAILPLISLLRG
jgi:hypothetical protein